MFIMFIFSPFFLCNDVSRGLTASKVIYCFVAFVFIVRLLFSKIESLYNNSCNLQLYSVGLFFNIVGFTSSLSPTKFIGILPVESILH